MENARRKKTSVRFTADDLALLTCLQRATGLGHQTDALRLAIREAVASRPATAAEEMQMHIENAAQTQTPKNHRHEYSDEEIERILLVPATSAEATKLAKKLGRTKDSIKIVMKFGHTKWADLKSIESPGRRKYGIRIKTIAKRLGFIV